MFTQIRQDPIFRVQLLFFCITVALSDSTEIGSCLKVTSSKAYKQKKSQKQNKMGQRDRM